MNAEEAQNIAFRREIRNKIFHEDSLSLLKKWPCSIIDACIIDPPYNIARDRIGLSWAFSSHVTMKSQWDRFSHDDYKKFTLEWMKEVVRVTKKNGNIFIFGTYHNIFTIGFLAKELNLRIINSIIWAKPNAQPNITCRMFTESTEQILWLCNNDDNKAKHWTFNYEVMKTHNDGKQMRNFWIIPTTPKSERLLGQHPTQKPLKLMERIVLAATNPKDLVLDCFSGTGTTLLALKMHGRHYVGIDNNQDYIDIAKKRLAIKKINNKIKVT